MYERVSAKASAPQQTSFPMTESLSSSDPIHLVTWYKWDALRFKSLVTLLTTHPRYTSSVQRLELVVPCSSISGNTVPKNTLVELTQWIVTRSCSLQQVVLLTLLPQQPELELVRFLEQACHNKANLLHGCTIKNLEDTKSQVGLLCDYLRPDNTTGQRRHLALDGALLRKILKPELQQ
jgi:hypothetical protein